MFYVYAYYHPVTRVPVYIGKGKGGRYKQHLTNSSNDKLKSFIDYYGGDVISNCCEVILRTDNENEALATEEYLINSYGRVTDGGSLFNTLTKGSSNISVKLDETTKNLLGTMTDRELSEISGVNWSTLRDRRHELGIPSYKEVNKGTSAYGEHFLKEDTVVTLYDTNGRFFKGGRRQLCNMLGLSNPMLGSVLSGKRKHVKGYFIKPTDNVTPYTEFVFTNGSEKFVGTYSSFADKQGYLKRSVRNICTGHRKDLHGWVAERVIYE